MDLSGLGIETMGQAAAIDVEGFEDLQDGFDGNVPVVSPADDVEIFLAGLETIENAIKQKSIVLETTLEQAKVAAVQLHPESFALEVFQPAGPQIAPPVTLHPAADGLFPEITPSLFAFNPLVLECLLLSIHVHARLFHGSEPLEPLCPVGQRSLAFAAGGCKVA